MRVSAIIPAFNEQNTIKDVLEVLKKSKDVNEILVVSDGSTDRTVQVCRECKIDVIDLPRNMGKSSAMKIGEQKSTGDVLLFLDADLIGLNSVHINSLIWPIIDSRVDMTVGVFTGGRRTTDFAHRMAPFLSGQRAIKKEVFSRIAHNDIHGYGIETALTVCSEKGSIKVAMVDLEGLTHVMKEEKLGLIKGFGARVKMYREIYMGLKGAWRKQIW